MNVKNISLRIRIFLSMIFLVLLASISIVTVTIYQYKNQTQKYNRELLERKEKSIQTDVNYELTRRATYPAQTEYLSLIFRKKIYEISITHSAQLYVYDMSGNLLISSQTGLDRNRLVKEIPNEILEELEIDSDHHLVREKDIDQYTHFSSYTYITDDKHKYIGILNVQYLQDNSHQKDDLDDFLIRLSIVHITLFLFGITLAYFISSYITSSLKEISDRLHSTNLDTLDKKIELKYTSRELQNLIDAYNRMIDALEESRNKLAKSERESAWREMAKQVAHEIKNPLTPMRLTVQSFERSFDPSSTDYKEKLSDFSKKLIQQIDTMSSIASAFSTFAKMPSQNKEQINLYEVIKLALDIFNAPYIKFICDKKELYVNFDKTQMIRIITNLVKNAIQALENIRNPKIIVSVMDLQEKILIHVSDNGKGIPEDIKNKIFEPKFTTKNSGMGLGLPMIKNILQAYKGTINFNSQKGKGTVFIVEFKK